MNEALIISIVALIGAVASAVKGWYDNKEIKKWICMRNPCETRLKGDNPEK